MTPTFSEAFFTAESETIAITMNETIPVLLVAGLITTVLIIYFIAFVVLSMGTSKTNR